MMTVRSWTVGILMLGVLVSGCGTMQQEIAEREYTPPTSIYNILDSTALVYSDPAAGSAINDHPLRWMGFVMHPVTQAVDYGINRPAYMLSSWFAYVTGYTAEDNMVDAQRR